MAEVNANSLPAKTDLGTNDSAIVVDQTTNAGALVDLDVLADKVLDRISSKTFANQVGGSSAATLLAQLSTLNSNFDAFKTRITPTNINESINVIGGYLRYGRLVIINLSIRFDENVSARTDLMTLPAPNQACCFISANTNNGYSGQDYYLTQSGILRFYNSDMTASDTRYAITGAYCTASA